MTITTALATTAGRGHGAPRNDGLLGHREKVGGQELGSACSEVQNGELRHRVYMHQSLGQYQPEGKAMNGCSELRKLTSTCLSSFFPPSLTSAPCPSLLYSSYHLFLSTSPL